MKLLNSMLEHRRFFESVIDYPQDKLCPDVWTADEPPKLIPAVKDKVFELLKKYKQLDLTKFPKVHITGSIGTNQYADSTDVDVHIVVDEPDKLPTEKIPEDWQKDVFKFFKDRREELGGYIGVHPVEVYLQLNPAQELLSDAVYDVNKDEWVKGPLIQSLDFDPYQVYKSVVDDIAGVVGDADELLGELKRDVIDYSVIKSAMTRLPKEQKEALLTRLKQKLAEIEEGIDKLLKNKKEWLDMRKAASKPTTPDQALTDVALVKNWVSKNALFKFLDRYQYLRLISTLEKMMDDDKITDVEVDTIKNLLGVMS